jgi:hypothetical protein
MLLPVRTWQRAASVPSLSPLLDGHPVAVLGSIGARRAELDRLGARLFRRVVLEGQ